MAVCKNCGKELISTDDSQGGHPTVCPSCDTVFFSAEDLKNITSFRPSYESKPWGMSIDVVDDILVIKRRRFKVIYSPLLIVFFMLFYGLFFSDLHTAEFLLNPLTWFMFGLGYFALNKLLNSTEVRVNREQLVVKRGPLPPRQNTRINSQDIWQLYVKRQVSGSGKNKSVTYPVYVVDKNDQHKELVPGLGTPQYALYIEQEIERFLGLQDLAMPGEHERLFDEDFSGWRTFAHANNLSFTDGKLLEAHRVYGNYREYEIELAAVKPITSFSAQTRLTLSLKDELTRADVSEESLAFEDHLILDKVANITEAPLQSDFGLKGKFTVSNDGRKFIYKQDNIETYKAHLQFIFDTLHNLADAYPQIIPLGAEVIPILQSVANDKNHPAQAVAVQLIREIAPTTIYLHKKDEALLVCPQCLVRCAEHSANVSWLVDAVYFGCRQCHQSRTFFEVDRIVAVLDNRSNSKPVQQELTLTVNWLNHRKPFDFDAIKIIRATDEDVERFAVQVGNDTDPVRQPRYKQMRCQISSGCKLSENTLRILRRTFRQVNIEDDAGPGLTLPDDQESSMTSSSSS